MMWGATTRSRCAGWVTPGPGLTLERPTTVGAPPPPPKTEVTIVGKNEIYNRENLIGPFLVHKLSSPKNPPLPPLSSSS